MLRHLPYATSAPFNSSRRQHDPQCLSGTRVNVLEGIYSWIEGSEGPPLYWLSRLAGTGKSTIARTVAQTYHEKGLTLASFFFSEGSGDAESAANFFTTIAAQLAARNSNFRSLVGDTVKANPRISEQSFRDQLQELILMPLSGLRNERTPQTILLVVDALDECGEEQSINSLLNLFTDMPRPAAGQIRIFTTSRPEYSVRHHLSEKTTEGHRTFVLHRIAPDIVDADINTYLTSEFSAIRKERGYNYEWPSAGTIEELTRNAADLFIYAATACRFVRQGKVFARQRLERILDSSLSTGSEPTRQLDQIYLKVLAHAVPMEFALDEKVAAYAQLRLVLGTLITVSSNLTVKALAALLDIPPEDLEAILEDLHAVLDFTGDQDLIVHLHHPSFRDFLTNSERCTDERLLVDKLEIHTKLAHGCLQVMHRTLHPDICGMKQPGAMNRRTIATRISPELRYSCQHWISHWENAAKGTVNQGLVSDFLVKHFLHCIEVLSWCGTLYLLRSLWKEHTIEVSTGVFAASREHPQAYTQTERSSYNTRSSTSFGV